MSPRKKRSSMPPVSDVDRIGDLPDSILHHLLSFLLAQAAVQTCVLARRWRHLWRSTTSLRIVGLDGEDPVKFQHLRKFVDHLLNLRERTDLDTLEIKLEYDSLHDNDGSLNADAQTYVNLWIRSAVMCKVRVLNINIFVDIYLDNLPLVSRHLRTLYLDGVTLQEAFLDFASCPALENLKIGCSRISAGKVSSRSLKHLSIIDCCSNLEDCRVCVSAPALVSLEIGKFVGRTPFLENMPLLETAYVELGRYCEDVCICRKYDSGVFCGADNTTCQNCILIKGDCRSGCVLLGGISSAKHLKLLSVSRMFIFTRDLKHCPAFSKLTNLLLNEYWCEAPDLDPLACILKNSPVLEKLTLQLFSKGPNHKVEMKGRYSSMEGPFAISEHLKIVEVKCSVVDDRILKVLKFLSAFNICFSF